MKTVIRLSSKDEVKALPILLRHSAGMVLRGRTYVIEESAARALRHAGVPFEELIRESSMPRQEGVVAGERI